MEKQKKLKRKKGFLDKFIEWALPGYHIARNPCKHTKKRKIKEPTSHFTTEEIRGQV